MDREKILNEINVLLEEGEIVLSTKHKYNGWDYVDTSKINVWKTRILSFFSLFLKPDNPSILKIQNMKEEDYEEAITCLGIVKSIKSHIENGLISFENQYQINTEDTLDRIFARFHKVVRQLRNRHENKPTIEIEDEYDVQDLLHALLQLYFDDIRAEEWTPSYAGKSSRMDFLLKKEKIVIEVKKTRRGLGEKEIGDQLIIDIDRYKEHPDCSKLICFVYDPEARIGNPIGLMKDLNSRHKGFMKVIIHPSI